MDTDNISSRWQSHKAGGDRRREVESKFTSAPRMTSAARRQVSSRALVAAGIGVDTANSTATLSSIQVDHGNGIWHGTELCAGTYEFAVIP